MPESSVHLRITGDAQPFAGAVKRAVGSAGALGGAVASINQRLAGSLRSFAGFFGAGFVLAKIRQSIDEAGRLRDKATALGLTTSQLQERDFAARQTGSSPEKFEIAQKTLVRSQSLALQGSKELQRAFERQGVTMEDLRKKQPDQLFEQIGRKMKGTTIDTVKLADAMRLMGESGEAVLPAMVAGLDDLAQAARDAGVVIEEEVVQKLADAGDQMTTLGGQTKGIFAELTLFLTSWLGEIVDLIDMAKSAPAALQGAFWGTQGGVIERYKAGLKAAGAERDRILDARIKRERALEERAQKRRGPAQDPAVIEQAAKMKRVQELQEKLAEAQEAAAFKQLDREGQINELIRRRAELLKQIAASRDDEERLGFQLEQSKLDEALAALQERGGGAGGAGGRPSVDQLTRIGATTGAFNQQASATRTLTHEVRKIGTQLGRINGRLDSLDGK